jgi:acetyl/propionyl-CoA carboxylase alpha subunit
MKRALHEFVLLGVRTNIEFLQRLIATEDFRSGAIDTHFIERHPDILGTTGYTIPAEVLVAASLTEARSLTTSSSGTSLPAFPDVWTSGPWRNA